MKLGRSDDFMGRTKLPEALGFLDVSILLF